MKIKYYFLNAIQRMRGIFIWGLRKVHVVSSSTKSISLNKQWAWVFDMVAWFLWISEFCSVILGLSIQPGIITDYGITFASGCSIFTLQSALNSVWVSSKYGSQEKIILHVTWGWRDSPEFMQWSVNARGSFGLGLDFHAQNPVDRSILVFLPVVLF